MTTLPRDFRCEITYFMLSGLLGAIKAQLSAITSFVYTPRPTSHHSLISLPTSAVVSQTWSTGSQLAHTELKMCLFHYKKFESCGDYGIEVSHVCDEALWRAGLRGVLQICVPRILERSLEWSGPDDHEPPKPAFFRGYDGFCEMCVERFKVC